MQLPSCRSTESFLLQAGRTKRKICSIISKLPFFFFLPLLMRAREGRRGVAFPFPPLFLRACVDEKEKESATLSSVLPGRIGWHQTGIIHGKFLLVKKSDSASISRNLFTVGLFVSYCQRIWQHCFVVLPSPPPSPSGYSYYTSRAAISSEKKVSSYLSTVTTTPTTTTHCDPFPSTNSKKESPCRRCRCRCRCRCHRHHRRRRRRCVRR